MRAISLGDLRSLRERGLHFLVGDPNMRLGTPTGDIVTDLRSNIRHTMQEWVYCGSSQILGSGQFVHREALNCGLRFF